MSPSSVTAGGSATLTVDAGTAAPGTYSLTITGAAASATHSTTLTLTINSPPDFSVAISPASRTVATGGSTTFTVTTAAVNGSTQSIVLSVSGLPSGVTGVFSPTSVTAGGSSTLTLTASASAAPTTATFAVTGTSGATVHSASASVTVTTAPPSDFSIAVSPSSGTVAAGSSTAFTVSTAVVSGSTQSIALSVSGLPSGVTGSFSPASVTTGGSSTLTVTASATAPAATAIPFTVTGTSSTTTHSASASLTVTAAGGTTVLTNGVPITGISGATGSQKFYVLSVPPGQMSLTFTTSGGTGDADLYVRFGALPTTTTFNCRPFVNGNSETCSFNNPAAGNWFVMLRGFTAYSGVTLKGTYAADTTLALVNGVPVAGISGAINSQQFWKLSVPAGRANVTFTISGGTGDADLYVRFGARPTTSTFNCRPFLNGNNETCTIANPTAGDWFVMIRGFSAYSGVTLKGLYP